MSNMKTSIYAAIEQVANAEKITRTVLAGLSRDMLMYVPESQDIEAVNRLLNVLTPVNRRVAILYFAHFLPWEQEKDADGKFTRFGKKSKSDKKLAKSHLAIKEWLKDEKNTIWSWSDDNIELKQKDLVGLLSRAIKKALEGDEKTDTPAMTMGEVVDTFLAQGVDVDTLLEGIDRQEKAKAEAEAEVMDPRFKEEPMREVA